FFSSRRRHTRWPRDWSSDVCSSDLLHHVMPDYDLYSPSYLIAAVRKSELIKRLRSRLGETWWDSRKAGDYLKQIMSPGANIDLDEFSKLDTSPFLRPLLKPEN